MNAKTLHATGTCFDDAVEIAHELCKETPGLFNSGDVWIVHGICLSQAGMSWSHAWVEHKDSNGKEWAMWMGLEGKEKVVLACTKAEHYEFHRPRKVIYYSPPEFWKINRIHEHFGPFDEEIQQHCATPETAGKPIDCMHVNPL